MLNNKQNVKECDLPAGRQAQGTAKDAMQLCAHLCFPNKSFGGQA
jgi:hypothetical protein